jgi:hypothetical protein
MVIRRNFIIRWGTRVALLPVFLFNLFFGIPLMAMTVGFDNYDDIKQCVSDITKVWWGGHV